MRLLAPPIPDSRNAIVLARVPSYLNPGISMKAPVTFLLSLLALSSCAPPVMRVISFGDPKPSYRFAMVMKDHPRHVEATAQHVGVGFKPIKGPVAKSITKDQFDSIWNRLHSVNLRELDTKASKLPESRSYTFMVGLTSGKDRAVYKVDKKNAPGPVKSVVKELQEYDDL
jgi:hypothetical protein